MEQLKADFEQQIKKAYSSREKVDLLNDLPADFLEKDRDYAFHLCDQACQLANEIEYHEGLIRGLINKAKIKRLDACLIEAKDFAASALDLTKIKNNHLKVDALIQLGQVAWNQSDYQQARQYYEKGLNIAREDEDEAQQADLLNRLGEIHGIFTELEKAFDYFNQSLALYQKLREESGVGTVYGNFGNVFYSLGYYDQALYYYQESYKKLEDRGSKDAMSILVGNIGTIHEEKGDLNDALRYYEESYQYRVSTKNLLGQAFGLASLGNIKFKLGRFHEAIQDNHQAKKIQEDLGEQHALTDTLMNIGWLAKQDENYLAALYYYRQALKLSQEIGAPQNRIKALMGLGDLHMQLQNWGWALQYLHQSEFLLKDHPDKKLQQSVAKYLAECYESQGSFRKALDYFKAYDQLKTTLQDEQSRKYLNNLMIQLKLERAEKEKEEHRAQNIKLDHSLKELQQLHDDKNEFLAIAAHDLKNPLSGIQSLADLIKTGPENLSKNELVDLASVIERSSQHMFDIISKFLNINDLQAGKIEFKQEEVDLGALIEEVIGNYTQKAKEKHLNFKMKLPQQPVKLESDQKALTQILHNLISNAIKYSPHDKNIYVRAYETKDLTAIEVEDEGPGIKEYEKGKLFTKYASLSAKPTGSEKSTGLGLSIVKKLASALNGEVICKSPEGKGAKFVVKFDK